MIRRHAPTSSRPASSAFPIPSPMACRSMERKDGLPADQSYTGLQTTCRPLVSGMNSQNTLASKYAAAVTDSAVG
jgi:hypothetical protein